jgi:hypothetical protein
MCFKEFKELKKKLQSVKNKIFKINVYFNLKNKFVECLDILQLFDI